MFNVFFYQDKDGNSPLLEYIQELTGKTDKSSRIKATKIQDYIKYLQRVGVQARKPYATHLDGDI